MVELATEDCEESADDEDDEADEDFEDEDEAVVAEFSVPFEEEESETSADEFKEESLLVEEEDVKELSCKEAESFEDDPSFDIDEAGVLQDATRVSSAKTKIGFFSL